MAEAHVEEGFDEGETVTAADLVQVVDASGDRATALLLVELDIDGTTYAVVTAVPSAEAHVSDGDEDDAPLEVMVCVAGDGGWTAVTEATTVQAVLAVAQDVFGTEQVADDATEVR